MSNVLSDGSMKHMLVAQHVPEISNSFLFQHLGTCDGMSWLVLRMLTKDVRYAIQEMLEIGRIG